DEVGEHEVDHWSGAGHGGAARQADEAALADRRVAQANGAILFEEAGGGLEVAAALADPFAKDEDGRIGRHRRRQRLVCRLHERDFATGAWRPGGSKTRLRAWGAWGGGEDEGCGRGRL